MAGHVIHLNTTVASDPEQIWGVLTDVEHASTVMRSVTASRQLTDGPYDVGTTWEEQRVLFGHHGVEELHVVECDPPYRTLQESRLGHDTVRTAYSLTPTRDGHTKLSLTATAVMKERTPVGKAAWKFFGGLSYESTRRALQHDLEDIAREAERRSAS
jgi:hypothetical protein